MPLLYNKGVHMELKRVSCVFLGVYVPRNICTFRTKFTECHIDELLHSFLRVHM